MSPIREWLRTNWVEAVVVVIIAALVGIGWRLTVDVAVMQRDLSGIEKDVSEIQSDTKAIRDTLARMESRLGVKVEELEKDQDKLDDRLSRIEAHARPVSQPAPKPNK